MHSERTRGIAFASARTRIPSIVTWVVGAALLIGAGSARAGTLDEEILRHAPEVLDYLRVHGFMTVGVLKFRVQNGEGPASDHVGPLNLNLATRLELALVLTTDINHPVNIIRDASAVAAHLPEADHLKPAGRQALFKGRYRMAWGDQVVPADAFLTGAVAVSPDRHEVTVAIMGFGRDSAGLEPVVKFTASTDPPVLIELGESYLTRGAFSGGRVMKAPAEIIASVAQVREQKQTHPLLDPAAAVSLEVEYDNRPVRLEESGGEILIQEPREGQTVAFVLRKRDPTPTRYGVVLQVNGLNTLYRERSNPLNCSRWILSRAEPEIRVRGFYTPDQAAEAFKIVAREEFDAMRMTYGPDLGTINLVVFREQAAGEPRKGPRDERPAGPALDEEAEDLAVLRKGAFPAGQALNLPAMRQQLQTMAGPRSVPRGLIAEGVRIDAPVRRIVFDPEPFPMMSAKVTYYRPR